MNWRTPGWIALGLVLVLVLAVAGPAVAQESPTLEKEIVVTAERMRRSVEETGASVTVLTRHDLEQHQIHLAADALRLVPGAWLTQAGGPGGPTSLFLRGAGSNQTVVLVDGVKVNDPTLGGQFNFYDLDLVNVERVEVLRGAASTFYGSDALGGVVNIVTRKGEGKPEFRAGAEGGSFGHYRAFVSGSGEVGKLDFSFSGARNRWHNDLPHDEFVNSSGATCVGFEPGEGTRVEVRGRWFSSRAHDPWDFPTGAQISADPNIRRDRRTALGSVLLRQDVGDRLTFKLLVSDFDVKSRLVNGPDHPGDPDELFSRSDAEVRTGTLTGTWRAPKIADAVDLRAMVGAEYEDEFSKNFVSSPFGSGPSLDQTVRDRAGFLLCEAGFFDRVTLSGGLRRDRNSFFGWATTASASALVKVPETGTELRANYGEAFRAPKPIEFDDPYVGNPNLAPEKGVTWDAGMEQKLLDGDLSFTATFFRLRGRNFIVYDPTTLRLENFGRIHVNGVELSSLVHPVSDVTVRGWFTWQDPVNDSAAPGQSSWLPGRARRFGGADVTWRIDPVTLGASVIASGDEFSTGKITPDGRYRSHPGRKLLIGLSAEWHATKHLTITARLENLLNYDWYDDETTPSGNGRGVTLGFVVDF